MRPYEVMEEAISGCESSLNNIFLYLVKSELKNEVKNSFFSFENLDINVQTS
jgi:hypothetical protein